MRIADFIGEVTEYDKKERLVDYKHQVKKLPRTHYRITYFTTNSSASTYISVLIFLSFILPAATLITT